MELQEDGTLSEIPYYASFDKVASDEPLDVSSDNGNKVFVLDRKTSRYGELRTMIFSMK